MTHEEADYYMGRGRIATVGLLSPGSRSNVRILADDAAPVGLVRAQALLMLSRRPADVLTEFSRDLCGRFHVAG